MPSARDDAKTLAEAGKIRDDDERRNRIRELMREKKKKKVSEMESGAAMLSKPKLRKQWQEERIDGVTDLQWDEWLAKRQGNE